ncbi:hypothetical protein QE152_g33494 [Popillia japonica]|uniref:Uncharacterized protein n=1 Tax=Popillia japonica TaxID=7064 RepID=A0AAW1IWR7_POPJA
MDGRDKEVWKYSFCDTLVLAFELIIVCAADIVWMEEIKRIRGIRGKVKKDKGRPTCLDIQDEKKLAESLKTLEKWGFGLSRLEVSLERWTKQNEEKIANNIAKPVASDSNEASAPINSLINPDAGTAGPSKSPPITLPENGTSFDAGTAGPSKSPPITLPENGTSFEKLLLAQIKQRPQPEKKTKVIVQMSDSSDSEDLEEPKYLESGDSKLEFSNTSDISIQENEETDNCISIDKWVVEINGLLCNILLIRL